MHPKERDTIGSPIAIFFVHCWVNASICTRVRLVIPWYKHNGGCMAKVGAFFWAGGCEEGWVERLKGRAGCSPRALFHLPTLCET